MSVRTLVRSTLFAATAAFAASLAGTAVAQDLNAYMANAVANSQAQINAAMGRMNNIVGAAENRVAVNVQAGMANPQMQAQYMQYQQQMAMTGRPAMSFAQYVYSSQYTQNFSAGGMAHAANNEAGIRAAEAQRYAQYQAALANRGAAQMGMWEAGARRSAEVGNLLSGVSNYGGGQYGGTAQLPHTWGANTYQNYQGNQYHVDASGQYWQRGSNGYWYGMQQR